MRHSMAKYRMLLLLLCGGVLWGCQGEATSKDGPPPAVSPRFFKGADGIIWTNLREVHPDHEDIELVYGMQAAGRREAVGRHLRLDSFQCPDGMADQECALNWLAKERENAKAEFTALVPFEDDVAKALEAGDVYLGISLLRRAASTPFAASTLPRHDHDRRSGSWKQRAVPFGCWNATYKMRGWLAEVGTPNQGRVGGDLTPEEGAESIERAIEELRKDYVASARECETFFRLAHHESKLRQRPVHVRNIVGEIPGGVEAFTSDMREIASLP